MLVLYSIYCSYLLYGIEKSPKIFNYAEGYLFNAGFIFFYCTVRIISLNILKLLGTLTLKQFIHFLLLLTLILYKVYVFGFDKKTTTFHIVFNLD